jgi:hypothetical protein
VLGRPLALPERLVVDKVLALPDSLAGDLLGERRVRLDELVEGLEHALGDALVEVLEGHRREGRDGGDCDWHGAGVAGVRWW